MTELGLIKEAALSFIFGYNEAIRKTEQSTINI